MLIVGLLVVGALAFGAWYGMRQVYFLGSDEGGRLALYRGLPYDLPFEIELYSQVHSAPVQVSSLPEGRRSSATDHQLRSRSDAIDLLHDLELVARQRRSPARGREPGSRQQRQRNEGRAGQGANR